MCRRIALAGACAILTGLLAPAAFAADVTIAVNAHTDMLCPDCFSPMNVTVVPGEAVTWYNNGTVEHTITSGTERHDGGFYSGFIHPGKTFSHEFSKSGTYPYYCSIHMWMRGNVSVQDDTRTDPPRLVSSINDPRDAAIYEASGKQYAVITGYANSIVQILDMGDLSITGSVRGGSDGYGALNGPQDIEMIYAEAESYALVASYLGDAVQIINVTDPARMAPVAAAVDGAGGFEYLAGARDIETYAGPDGTYAFVSAVLDHAIQIINVTDPTNPQPAGFVRDESFASSSSLGITSMNIAGNPHLFVSSEGNVVGSVLDIADPTEPVVVSSIYYDHPASYGLSAASDMRAFVVSDRTYLAVADNINDSVHLLDITNTSDPILVSTVRDGENGFDGLGGPSDIEVIQTPRETYAVVTANGDHAMQVMDVTRPADPVPVSSVAKGQGGFVLEDPWDTEFVTVPGSGTLAIVIGSNDNIIQTMNFTDPSSPVAAAVGRGVPDGSAPRNIEVYSAGNSTYALGVGLGTGDSLDVIEVTEPGNPVKVGSVAVTEIQARTNYARAFSVSPGQTFALVSTLAGEMIHIVNVTDPASPVRVSTMQDGVDGFELLDGVFDIAVFAIYGKTYAMVAAFADNAVHIIDVTNPASPVPVSTIQDGVDGFESLRGARDVDVFEASGSTYGIVSSTYSSAVQIINVTNPASPVPVSTIQDGVDGFESLRGVVDSSVFSVSGRINVIATSIIDEALQVIDVTNPASPVPVSTIQDGVDGFESLRGVHDVEVFEVSGEVHAAITAKSDSAIHIVNMTDPASPVPLGTITASQFASLDSPADAEPFTISGMTYLLVLDRFGDNVTAIDVTDPSKPVAARAPTDRYS